MHLNHPKTIPTSCPGPRKTVFHKTHPWCQKCWGPLGYMILILKKKKKKREKKEAIRNYLWVVDYE